MSDNLQRYQRVHTHSKTVPRHAQRRPYGKPLNKECVTSSCQSYPSGRKEAWRLQSCNSVCTLYRVESRQVRHSQHTAKLNCARSEPQARHATQRRPQQSAYSDTTYGRSHSIQARAHRSATVQQAYLKRGRKQQSAAYTQNCQPSQALLHAAQARGAPRSVRCEQKSSQQGQAPLRQTRHTFQQVKRRRDPGHPHGPQVHGMVKGRGIQLQVRATPSIL